MKKTTTSADAPPADDILPPAGEPTPPAGDPSTTADETPPRQEPVVMPHAGGSYVRNADGSLTKQEG